MFGNFCRGRLFQNAASLENNLSRAWCLQTILNSFNVDVDHMCFVKRSRMFKVRFAPLGPWRSKANSFPAAHVLQLFRCLTLDICKQQLPTLHCQLYPSLAYADREIHPMREKRHCGRNIMKWYEVFCHECFSRVSTCMDTHIMLPC